jgi:hypothetical protein
MSDTRRAYPLGFIDEAREAQQALLERTARAVTCGQLTDGDDAKAILASVGTTLIALTEAERYVEKLQSALPTVIESLK